MDQTEWDCSLPGHSGAVHVLVYSYAIPEGYVI